MKKDNECEIIQDLLLNYVDGLLNDSSKCFVESHLKNCSDCSAKLEDLQDTENTAKIQEKEIDYLKKLKFKSRRNSIIGAIIIILIIFLVYYFSKFFIINSISEKASKQFESENIYIEIIAKLGPTEDGVSFTKTWYKNGRYKTVSYIETEKDGITQHFDTSYGEVGKKEQYLINETSKTAQKVIYPFESKKTSLMSLPNPIFLSSQDSYMIFRLGAPFHTKISTDHKDIGRKYYVLELSESKLWVDIDTGLPIMSFGYSSSTKYYKDTKIPMERYNGICQYNYEFGTVKDEDVTLPNLSEYELSENTSLVDLINDDT